MDPIGPGTQARLDRVLRLIRLTIEVFQGDIKPAFAWLTRENIALDNRIPVELLETEAGAREVEVLLGRIEHGVYS